MCKYLYKIFIYVSGNDFKEVTYSQEIIFDLVKICHDNLFIRDCFLFYADRFSQFPRYEKIISSRG